MAFTRDYITTTYDEVDSGNSFELPTHVAGDYLIWTAGAITSQSTPSGWTLLASSTSTGLFHYAFGKEAGSPETAPTGSFLIGCIMSVDGVDTADVVNATVSTGASSTVNSAFEYTMDGVTTDENNCLVLKSLMVRFAGGVGFADTWDSNHWPLCNRLSQIYSTTTGLSLGLVETSQDTAGATGGIVFYCRNTSVAPITLAINLTSAFDRRRGSWSGDMLWSNAYANRYLEASRPTISIETLHSSLAGITTHAATLTYAIAGAATTLQGDYAVVNIQFGNVLANTLWGAVWETGGWDVTTGQVMAAISSATDAASNPFLHAVYLEDSLGEWVLLRLALRAPATSALATQANYQLYIPSLPELDSSSGTIDYTDIEYIGFCNTANAARVSRGVAIANLCRSDGFTLFGGSSSAPLTPRDITHYITCDRMAPDNANQLGRDMRLLRHPLTLGDGTTPTYFRATGSATEQPASLYQYQLTNDFYGAFLFHLSASCNLDFSGSILKTSLRQTHGPITGSSTSGTVDYDGCYLEGWRLEWRDGIRLNGASIRDSFVNLRGGLMDGCTIRRSPATTAAIEVSDGATWTDCEFTSNAETYAVEITEAGDYDASGASYSGYAKPLYISATTGTVTITIGSDDSEPTYDSDGATVVFDQSVAGTSWKNEDLANGTKVLVTNVTADTTIDYETTSGGTGYTIVMVPGVDYTVGDRIEVRQGRQSGTSYFIERTTVINTTAGGGDFVEIGDLDSCPICDAIGLDGSDFDSVFELDYVDNELDIEVAGAWQTGQLMSWYKWESLTQAAMEQFWNAWAVQSDGSFRNDVDVLSSRLDTTETGDSIETTGRRIYRSDGARPIKSPTTGGGAIDCAWREPVTLVATGSGVLPADITAIAVAVDAEGGALAALTTYDAATATQVQTATDAAKLAAALSA